MITKVVYIHKNKPFDIYKTNTDDGDIISSSVLSIDIYQDLSIASVEGEIIFVDVALYNLLPLHYEDKIRIHLINTLYDENRKEYTIGKEYYLEFRIISTQMVVSEPGILDKDNQKKFKLNLLDDNSFKGYLYKQSRMYFNRPMSYIISDTINNITTNKNNIKINKNIIDNAYNITLPKWSVYEQLNYLSKFTEFSDGCGTLYYNSLPLYYVDGKSDYNFYYTNLTSLINIESDYVKEEYSLTSEHNNIHNIFLDKDHNCFELTNKGLNINGHKLSDIRRNKLGKYIPTVSELINNNSYGISTPMNPTEQLDYYSNNIIKNIFDNVRIFVTVNGDVKRKLGTVISLKFPSGYEAYNKRDYYEEQHTGKYIIKSIEHVFVRDNDYRWIYNQKLGLITDGYNKDDFGIMEINK